MSTENLDVQDVNIINALKDGQSDAYIAEQFGVDQAKIDSLKGIELDEVPMNESDVELTGNMPSMPSTDEVVETPTTDEVVESPTTENAPVESTEEVTEEVPESGAEVVASETEETTPENA